MFMSKPVSFTPAGVPTSMNQSSSTQCSNECTPTTDRSKRKPSSGGSTQPDPELSFEYVPIWRAAISQAIKDIYGTERDRREVILWLNTPDFDTVCDLAELPADEIHEQLTALIALPHGLAVKYGTVLRERIIRD